MVLSVLHACMGLAVVTAFMDLARLEVTCSNKVALHLPLHKSTLTNRYMLLHMTFNCNAQAVSGVAL